MDDRVHGSKRRSRGAASFAAAAACLAAVAVVAALSGSAVAGSLNVTGTWQTTYMCKVGCAGENFPDTITLTQAQGSSTVTGIDQSGATLAGTLSGNTLKMHEIEGSYTADFNVNVSANGPNEAWTGPLTDSNGTSGTDVGTLGAGASSGPTLAVSAQASSVTGTVSIEPPGGTSFRPLSSSSSIPMGSTIDATNGSVGLTVAVPGGHKQTGQFYDGEFKLTQAHSGVTTETLMGGDFALCTGATGASGPTGATGASGASGASGATAARAEKGPVVTAAAAKKTVVRSLWGNAHGKFTTSGRAGEASVLGTVWLTQDVCGGTLFTAKKHQITVTEFAHPKPKQIVKQGHSLFVAGP
jgi:hypothetical protein